MASLDQLKMPTSWYSRSTVKSSLARFVWYTTMGRRMMAYICLTHAWIMGWNSAGKHNRLCKLSICICLSKAWSSSLSCLGEFHAAAKKL